MNALIYAVRPRVALKYFGQLCIVFGAVTAVPLAVSLLIADPDAGLRYALVVSAALALGGLLTRFPTPRRLQVNEAMVVSALFFLFAALAASWPAMAVGLDFPDALFETLSAVTTTGLTVAASVEDKPPAFLFARSWMQWVGGLGIVVLSLAAMIQPGTPAKRFGDLEDHRDDLVGGTRALARRVLVVYASLTVAGTAALLFAGVGGFHAVLYGFAAVSTGGFSPHADSLSGLSGAGPAAVVVLVSVCGAVPLLSYHRTNRGGRWAFLRDRQLVGLLIMGLATTLALACLLRLRDGFAWWAAIRHGFLNAFSAQSTAGFSSLDIHGLDPCAKVVLIVSMFVGGSAGSTAGGVKIVRMLIVFRLIGLMVRKTAMPKETVAEPRLGGRRLEAAEVQSAMCLILLFVLAAVFSWLPFVAMGLPPLDALFEVVSAINTVGLSAGVAGPDLHPFLKGVLCADMLLGRLEIVAWLVVLAPGTWIGRRLEE